MPGAWRSDVIWSVDLRTNLGYAEDSRNNTLGAMFRLSSRTFRCDSSKATCRVTADGGMSNFATSTNAMSQLDGGGRAGDRAGLGIEHEACWQRLRHTALRSGPTAATHCIRDDFGTLRASLPGADAAVLATRLDITHPSLDHAGPYVITGTD